MHIAILSDIHSNLQALQKALQAIDDLRIERIYCLGDIVGYGANPNECIELIRERTHHCVLGNHDLAAVDSTHASYFTPEGHAAAKWTNRVLATDHLDFLQNLPYRITDGATTLVHAAPSEPEHWAYILTLDDAARQFHGFETPICFFGHTHIPSVCGEDLKTFTLTKEKKFLINVGSVGQPRDGNPQLSFGLLDTDTWSYENIRADYDLHKAAESIIRNGLPKSLADRLFIGA